MIRHIGIANIAPRVKKHVPNQDSLVISGREISDLHLMALAVRIISTRNVEV